MHSPPVGYTPPHNIINSPNKINLFNLQASPVSLPNISVNQLFVCSRWLEEEKNRTGSLEEGHIEKKQVGLQLCISYNSTNWTHHQRIQLKIRLTRGGNVNKAKASKEPKAKMTRSAKPSTPPAHPHFTREAIVSLKERTGLIQWAITKFIEEKHMVFLPTNFNKILLVHLRKLIAAEKIVKAKGSCNTLCRRAMKLAGYFVLADSEADNSMCGQAQQAGRWANLEADRLLGGYTPTSPE